MKIILCIITAATLLCGCASVGNNFDSRKIENIKKGETTEPQLIALFGKPTQRTINSETGLTLAWVYTEAHANAGTFFVGSVTTQTKSLAVQLGTDGKVVNYNYSNGGLSSRGTLQSNPENQGPKTP